MNNDLRKKVQNLWGIDPQSEEIIAVIERWGIDFDKLMRRWREKGQDYAMGMGAVLAMNQPGKTLLQCECGEVMGFPKSVVEMLTKLHPNEAIRCKAHDPKLSTKLSGATDELKKRGNTRK